MKKWLFAAAVLSFLSCIAGSTVRQEKHGGQNVYTLENEKLIISVSPESGGRGIRYYLKDVKKELVNPAKVCGLFLEHWAKHSWPSGLMNLPYSAEIVKIPGGAGLKLQLTIPEYGGGKGSDRPAVSRKMKTEKEFIGFHISKTIILKDGSDVVKVVSELKNISSESKSGSLYYQQGLSFNEKVPYYEDFYRWDMPSTDGFIGPAKKVDTKTSGKHWNYSPVAGWMSVSDLKDMNIVFEFDYNYLDRMYSCGTTAEWMMENVLLPAGKSFRTEYQFYPVYGFERLAHAKDGIAAGIRVDETRNGVAVYTDLISKCGQRKNLKLNVKVFSHRDKKVLAEKNFSVKELGNRVVTFSMECPAKEEIVVKAELVDQQGLNAQFEYNYFDEDAESNRRFSYATIGSGAAALAGGRGSAYQRKAPVKIKQLDLPDFSKIAKFPKDRNRMLVLFGLYTNHLKIFEAFQNDKNTEITWANAHPNGIDKFPASFEELFAYRTIFMCNVNYRSLRFDGFEMIRHWILQGGTLVITGGFYTYGSGEFDGTPFEKFIPFKKLKLFDLRWAGEGKHFLLKPTGKHPEFAGVDFSSDPDVIWLHQAEVKPEGKILATAGGIPAIVKMKYGKGTVIACTLTPMGESEKPFWRGEGWKRFLVNCSRINQN